MRLYKFYQVDVFTSIPFTGNPAGVVLDADGLDEKTMQQIARELNNSETAFLFKPGFEDHDVKIRFFTPTKEVPTCGHATIAAHFVRALELKLECGRYWYRIGIGRLPVDIEKMDDNYRVIMTQGVPIINKPFDRESSFAVLEALGISRNDWVSEFPIVRVDTGASKIMVGVKSRDILNSAVPDNEVLKKLGSVLNAKGFFVFTIADPDPDVLVHCRMFAPQIGIPEDPVTGNGNGPLGAYLVEFGLVDFNGPTLHFRSRQGETMGRPGTALVWVDVEEGKPKEVRVGGNSIIAFKSKFLI